MKSIFSINALTLLGGLSVQTFLKAFFVLVLLNGLIDLVLIRSLNSVSRIYFLGAGLAACLFLAWVFLLWKTEPPIVLRSILEVVPLLIGIGVFLVTGNWLWWLIVIIGYAGAVIWIVFFRAPALRAAMRQWNAGYGDRAIEILDRYIDSHAEAGDAYQYRAWFRVERAQYNYAEQDIKTALRLKPRSYLSHYVLGRILLEKGNIPKARESLHTAVKLGPGRGLCYLPLGIIHHLEAEPLLAVGSLSNGIGWGLPNASYYLVAYYYLGRNLDALDQPTASARAYQMMDKYWKGYDMLVNSLETVKAFETPVRKLYRADLSDMKQRLKQAVND